jgi:DNA-binding winged helix-turn-helix (wHTH) protein/Tol biopolymer transport system component
MTIRSGLHPKGAKLRANVGVAMPANSSSRIITFSTFEVNLDTGELRQRGQKVKLQEQPFQVLTALLERPGEVVSREELRRRLWPADTFVDFDHGLNAAIKRLRDVLGDAADTPIFIETLARRGYRFIAPVNGSSASGVVETAPAAEQGRSSFWTRRIAISCLPLIIIASLVWAMWRHPLQHTDIIERKLTSNSSENSVNSAAVSPDGKYLAYSDNTGVYLKLIRSGEVHSVPLPPNFSARVDDWFPDGSHLLVSRRDQSGKASLWNISVFGGSPRPLADDASGGSVSPNGAHISFHRAYVTNPVDYWLGREIWIMYSDGTDAVKVVADNGWLVGKATWSPDGKRIAYFRTKLDWTTRSVEVNEWQDARAETALSDNLLTPVLHWLPDGRLIYVLANEENWNQGSSLWMVWLQQSGKTSVPPKRTTQGDGWITQISGTTDGKKLVFLRDNGAPTAYIGTLAADGTTLIAYKRLTLDESVSIPSSWTSDSTAVLFSSDRNGMPEIFKQATDQPLAENLVTATEQSLLPRVTYDGLELLYISTPKSATPEKPSSIFAVPIVGGTSRLVLKDVNIWNVQCARLPSTVCMYSTIKGNVVETYRFDVKSGKSTGPAQIDPPCNWSLSPDGSQRAVIREGVNEGTIQFRSTSSDKTHDLVVKGWSGLSTVDWSADGKSLLLPWHNRDRESALLKVALDGKVSVLLRSSNFIAFAVPSPDGRLLAISEVSLAKNAWQMENFR